MCVATVAWDAHPDWLLVVAGNRDEYHARPAAPLSRWSDGSGIIAGTDLTGGGTWLGVTEAGRFALVTNYRVPGGSQPNRPSRGKLVTDLLGGIAPELLAEPIDRMNAFNLILVDAGHASFLTNYPGAETRPLAPGIHGLSNGGFDVPWPKTLQLNQAVYDWLDSGSPDFALLMAALRDEKLALPMAPGKGPEPSFAPVFIHNPIYGTRCSTVLAIDRKGQGAIVERSFDAQGLVTGEVRVDFAWPQA
jgi:uncharacterized protein with NRDE domain